MQPYERDLGRGITDITAVVVIAGANVAMILFGWLQERMNPPGRWRDYAYGEKAYLVLSLMAKSLLAWQIYGGSLAK